MNKTIAQIRSRNSVTLVINGRSYTMTSDNPNFVEVNRRLDAKEYAGIEVLFNPITQMRKMSRGKLVVSETGVTYDGVELHSVLVSRLLEFYNAGKDVEPMVRFLENLMQNPSNRSVQELYGFLEHKNLPITEDGCFLAYKAVRRDFYDIYSGTILNAVGSTITFNRNLVDDNCNNTCSHGLHVGSIQYVRWYGRADSNILIVKVNPKHVVSVPVDHNAQKVRVEQYEILSLYNGDLPSVDPTLPSSTWDDVDDNWEDEEVDSWREQIEDELADLEIEEDSYLEELEELERQLRDQQEALEELRARRTELKRELR